MLDGLEWPAEGERPTTYTIILGDGVLRAPWQFWLAETALLEIIRRGPQSVDHGIAAH